MRILIFTQKIDKNDTVLGFFHGWVTELSRKFDSIEVICLEKGEYDLPQNVTVYSLGKERGVPKFRYVINLYKYLSLIRGTYDAVFVHMNQEYVLLAGLYWKMKGIPVYLWRNHRAGSLLTRIAVALSTKVFCTSSQSFTARFKKAVIMPAGIDTEVFKPVEGIVRTKYSVCMVGRVSPVKKVDLALKAMSILASRGVRTSLAVIGPTLDKDAAYVESLKKYVEDNSLGTSVRFLPGVAQAGLPHVYSSYEICLNLTEAGSFDKTIVEATACGAFPLVSNESLQSFLPAICITQNDPTEVANSIERLLQPQERLLVQKDLENFVVSQSLSQLIAKLQKEISIESNV